MFVRSSGYEKEALSGKEKKWGLNVVEVAEGAWERLLTQRANQNDSKETVIRERSLKRLSPAAVDRALLKLTSTTQAKKKTKAT